MTTRIIRNCSVLINAPGPELRSHQDLWIQDSRIQAVQPAGAPLPAGDILEGNDLLVIPGLINAHTHSPENLLRGTSERLPLELWLVQQFTGLPNYPPQLIYLNTLAGAAEMLRSGTTAVLDHFWMAQSLNGDGLEAVMQAYADSGMRAALAPMLEDRDLMARSAVAANPELARHLQYQPPLSARELLAGVRELLHRWHGTQGNRLRVLLGPGGLQWASPQLLEDCRRLAKEYETGIHMHLNETRWQAEVCRAEYRHPAALELERAGLLGPGTSLAHAISIEPEEIEALARTRTTVIHNPVSNLKLGAGIAPIPALIDRGVAVGLGTDGSASNDNQNLFGVMKMTGLLHSPAVTPSERWISSKEIFTMATQGSAGAVGAPRELGRIEPGMIADLTCLDRSHTIRSPWQDPWTDLVYNETGASVRHVMVAGAWVVRDGQVLTFSEGEVFKSLQEEADRYFASFERDSSRVSRLLSAWKTAMDGSKMEIYQS